MERHSFGKSLFLLLAVVLQLDRLVQASSSAINCSLGIDEHTAIHADQIMNLRWGEDLIVNCKGDPERHSSLTLEYGGTHDVLKINKTTLAYSWYNRIEIDGVVEVSGFDVQPPHNSERLIAFTVNAHDLDALLEDPVTSGVNGDDGLANANLQNRSSTDEENTGESSTSNTAVPQDTRLYIIVAVLGIILIMAVVLLALVVMAKSQCKGSKVSNMEEGQTEHKKDPEVRVVVEGEAPPPEEDAQREEKDDKDTDTNVLNTSVEPLNKQ